MCEWPGPGRLRKLDRRAKKYGQLSDRALFFTCCYNYI